NDLFSFDIRYNDPTAGATALFNGNISQTRWRTNNTDNSLKHYSYSYDALNRITQATDNTGNYNLNAVSYDKNGNILSLGRNGHLNEAADTFGVMDSLVYSYDSGNKLLKVEDAADEIFGFQDDAVAVPDDSDDYSYDANGNMTSDTNKGITGITYNHLNLPTEIVFNNDPNRKISYIYSADGVKQRKVVTDNATITTTDYAGAYIYENSSLKFISQAEGYIEPDGAGGYAYVYQYKDMWGNIRLTYSDDNGDGIVDTSEIRREQNYYPYGLEHRGYNGSTSGVKNNLKTYQGQEFTEDLELNTHEWKYRISDPTIGRFWQI
ncbi:MAG: RHS repeat-associated core domain-containing protein, partial [Sinomicrobium sp.]|nr:RHS repeat-associated core domain-containing protein [Sinomicrobium sp.]